MEWLKKILCKKDYLYIVMLEKRVAHLEAIIDRRSSDIQSIIRDFENLKKEK